MYKIYIYNISTYYIIINKLRKPIQFNKTIPGLRITDPNDCYKTNLYGICVLNIIN